MRPLLSLLWVFCFFYIVGASFLLEPWLMLFIPEDGEGNLMVLIIAQMYYIFFFFLLNLVIGILSIYRSKTHIPFSFRYLLPRPKSDGKPTIAFKAFVFLVFVYDVVMTLYYISQNHFEPEAIPISSATLLLLLIFSWMLGVASESQKVGHHQKALQNTPSA